LQLNNVGGQAFQLRPKYHAIVHVNMVANFTTNGRTKAASIASMQDRSTSDDNVIARMSMVSWLIGTAAAAAANL
jgi:hypothetical protein